MAGHDLIALTAPRPARNRDRVVAPRAAIEEMTKKCPLCAERIKVEALLCRYCRHRFDPAEVSREIRQIRAGLAPAWCLVVDRVLPERREDLLAIVRELEPSRDEREIEAALRDGDITIARGLSRDQANAVIAHLLEAGVPARKMLETAAPRTIPPSARPVPAATSSRRQRHRGSTVSDVAFVASIGALALVALLLGYANLTRARSPKFVAAQSPATTVGDGIDGAAAGADQAGDATAPGAPPPAADRMDHVFFFSRGDRLASISGEPLGTVERLERKHTFLDGTVGPAYIVRTPAQTIVAFHASRLERSAHIE